jgi:hypothetical protein
LDLSPIARPRFGHRPFKTLLFLLPVTACTSLIDAGKNSHGTGSDGGDDTAPGTAEEACAESTPLSTTLSVTFDETYDGCAWGKNGNLQANDAHVSGRVEQTESLDLGTSVVLCDATFDFNPNGGVGQGMQYDDNFFFTFDDVVLAASYSPLVDEFARDGDLPIYSWDAIAGVEFGFDESTPTYCLGEDAGHATCTIPPPETNGKMSLSFDETIQDALAERALSQGRLDYGFITIGDNDNSDCSHAEFSFNVDVSYVEE